MDKSKHITIISNRKKLLIDITAILYVIITNKLSGKVLSLNSDSLFQNQSVIQKENNNSYLNKWIVKKENSSYKIVSAVKSNYVLACIDNKVVIQQEENNKNQEWI